jgi:hypothetical protein
MTERDSGKALMWNVDGTLTEQAVLLLNRAAGLEPVFMYPLSQLAADLGRAKLVEIREKREKTGGLNGLPERWTLTHWVVAITEAGWSHVTDPEALARHRCEVALKRLCDPTPNGEGWPS